MAIRFNALAGLVAVAALAACSVSSDVSEDQTPFNVVPPDSRPNILMIVADDMGYSDISPYGGEISTPNLQRLAERGVRMTGFRVHTMCTPTRAMLLSGANNHVAGVGTMAGEWRGNQRGAIGYETYLTDRVVTVPQLLSDAGYDTYISGKWDLGGRSNPDHLPAKRGFEESFVLVEGSADHFEVASALLELDKVHYQENGVPYEMPERFYSSDFFSDKLINYLDHDRDAPFFAMLTFTAPHWPLQAQDEYLEKYEGVYDVGYDAIREARLERMRADGVIGPDWQAAEPESIWPNWDELSEKVRELEAIRMQTYAAMVDSMDANIGRVLDKMEAEGQLDNTVVIFLSDNGATGANPLDWGPAYPQWAEDTYDNSLENLGRANSYVWTGPQWAHVSNAPFRLFKGFPTGGGIASPLIVSLPDASQPGRVEPGFVTATDMAATLLDLADVSHPGDQYKGREVAPLDGVSMLPVLLGEADAVRGDDDVMVWEIMGRRAVRKGNWKAVSVNEPWGAGADVWALYDLSADPTELTDIADRNPEVLKRLVADWDQYVAENGVLFDPYDNLVWSNTTDTHFEWRPEVAE